MASSDRKAPLRFGVLTSRGITWCVSYHENVVDGSAG